MNLREHDFEPIRGLPGELPEGERILWQGAPRWTTLAQQAFHIRAVAAYFAIMLGWRVAASVSDHTPLHDALIGAASVAPIALLALAILGGAAWLNSRTTVYTITNKRVVLRFGAAVPKAINLPFSIVEAGALKRLPGGAGDLALTLKAPNKIAILQLWPHARPWKLANPQPTLRCIPDAETAARVLALAIEGVFAVAAAPAAPKTSAALPGAAPVPA